MKILIKKKHLVLFLKFKDDIFFIPDINPLIAKEYLKEKLDQSTDIGEPAYI